MFDLIAEAAKEKTELEFCHPIVQKMMDIENKAKSLETYSHVVTYHKLGPIKALILPNNTININRYIYDKTNIKNTVNLCLTDSQVVEKLSSICDGMGALMVPPKSIFKKTNTWELTEEEKKKVNEYKPEPHLEGNKAEEKSSEGYTKAE